MQIQQVKAIADTMRQEICKRIIGKENVIDRMLIALFCGGHVLLDDLPGTGKTTLAKTMAAAMNADCKRIQFTPDLLPSDLTGVNIYDPSSRSFTFQKGAVFTHVLLADEINRATPRTQSALLECMAERQVTVDSVTYSLEPPFLVIATQNPVEWQGTFPLPEAQLDRFQFCLRMGYPDRQQEADMLSRMLDGVTEAAGVVTCEAIQEAQAAVRQVKIHEAVQGYLLDIAAVTRQSNEQVRVGISPRGLLVLADAARGYAALQGRAYVTPDDVRSVAVDTLAHRLILSRHGSMQQTDLLLQKRTVMQSLLERVPVPKEQPWDC